MDKNCCGELGGLLFGLFVLAIGVSWLGNDMGWWVFDLPWLPLAVSLFGLSMVVKWFTNK